ncbi:hypothetical protein CHELA41_21975 [Hyphomicrobiales bacterium]|nr:hypothetical protein CHELA41_21975 [Hyphomicrobiales bacterium]
MAGAHCISRDVQGAQGRGSQHAIGEHASGVTPKLGAHCVVMATVTSFAAQRELVKPGAGPMACL